jgi:hypothetical protein
MITQKDEMKYYEMEAELCERRKLLFVCLVQKKPLEYFIEESKKITQKYDEIIKNI